MIDIIKVESKRILSKRVFLMFVVIVFLFSAFSTYLSLRRYMVLNADGTIVTWQENLAHARINQQGKAIDREQLSFMREKDEFIYIDETGMNEIVWLNYEGKSIQELADEEIGSFYQTRLSRIRDMLEKNQYIQYTQKEKEYFLQKASQLSEIPFSYAEGWKSVNP